MPYDITLAQVNAGLGGLYASSTAWGFPANTNFHTLLMSYWMCGPVPPPATGTGQPGVWPAFLSAEFFGFGLGVNAAIAGDPFICFTNQAVWGAAPYTGFFSGNIPPPQPTAPVGCLLHMMMSVDTHAQIVQVYINDISVPVTGTWATGTHDFNIANTLNIWDWNVSAVTSSGIHPAMGDIWISNTPSFVDLSVVANRRKFISGAMTPVDLGGAGTIPFGYQPALYMSIRPGGVGADILLNRGVGGGSWGYAADPPTFQTDGFCLAIPAPPGAKVLTDAELLFSPTPAFVDFTNAANRRLFIASGGTPQWMGPVGGIPFGGATPAVYLTLPAAGERAEDFAQNNGFGGSFAVTEPITDASTTPGCTPYYVTEAAGPAANPEWRLSVSDDGGRTWSTLVKPRSIGKLGEYLTRLRWQKMGQSRERMIRLECTDPVRRNIVGVYIDAGQGMA